MALQCILHSQICTSTYLNRNLVSRVTHNATPLVRKNICQFTLNKHSRMSIKITMLRDLSQSCGTFPGGGGWGNLLIYPIACAHRFNLHCLTQGSLRERQRFLQLLKEDLGAWKQPVAHGFHSGHWLIQCVISCHLQYLIHGSESERQPLMQPWLKPNLDPCQHLVMHGCHLKHWP